MSAELLRDLARAKATFQSRTIAMVIGARPWVRPEIRRLVAGSAEGPNDAISPEAQ